MNSEPMERTFDNVDPDKPGELSFDTKRSACYLVLAGLPELQEINPAKVAEIIKTMATRAAGEIHDLQNEKLPSVDGLPEYVDGRRTMIFEIPLSREAYV